MHQPDDGGWTAVSTRVATLTTGYAVPNAERTVSPGAARRQLGELLRALREHAKLRLDEAGAHIERSQATLSRLENGKTMPRLVELRALLDLYDVGEDERDRALRLAGDSRKDEWFDPFRDVITGNMTQAHMLRYVEWETDAEEILQYEDKVVPGLLQTRGYAEATAQLFYPDSTAAQRKRFVDFRVARQNVLQRSPDPLEYRVTLREIVLRRVLGSPAVMAEQLGQLAAQLGNGMKNVELRIVPDDLVVAEALRGPFTIMRLPDQSFDDGDGLVYLEGAGGGEYLQNAAPVKRYQRDFTTLWDASLSSEESLELIEGAANKIG